jgi:hypothetical protein
MELLLFHPGPAAVPCEDCQKYVHRVDAAGRVLPQRHQHGGEDWLRPANVSPPCGKCPKRSPQEAPQHELSNKNRRTAELYFRVRATFGACLSERMRADALLAANLALVDCVVRRWASAGFSG